MKSEPDVFGIDDLAGCSGQVAVWDGVRNYQARNLLRDRFRPGDRALFYRSSCAVPGIVGLMDIVRAGIPDPSALDPASPYFDPRATLERPRWFAVEVRYRRHLRRVLALSELRRHAAGALAGWPLLQRGNRLSVLPVTPEQWRFVLTLEASRADERDQPPEPDMGGGHPAPSDEGGTQAGSGQLVGGTGALGAAGGGWDSHQGIVRR